MPQLEAWEQVFVSDDADEDAAAASWKMVEPAEAEVQAWQVREIASRIKRMKVAITYKPGQPGAVTAAEAGLEPPRAVVELTNKEGVVSEVEDGIYLLTLIQGKNVV